MVSETRTDGVQNPNAMTDELPVHPVESSDEFIFRLIHRTADARGCEITDLPPLARTIDPEAVASIAVDGNTTMRFEFADCEIFVGKHGALTVTRNEN